MRILALIMFFTSSAWALGSGIMLRPGGLYWSDSFKNGANPEQKTTTNHFDLSVGLGFRTGAGLYIGGTYLLIQEEQRVETTSTIETKETHTAYGPTIGYVGDNAFLLGTYHLAPLYVTGTDSSKVTYLGGYGYQIDLGYMFWFSQNVGLGPQVTYYYADFKKIKMAGGDESTLASTAAVTDIRPIFALAFMF